MSRRRTDRRSAAGPRPIVVEPRRLELNPGDAIAVNVAERLSVEQANRIRQELIAAFPGHRIVILEGGMSVTSRPDDDDLLERLQGEAENLENRRGLG
jgi:hypothetical protein